jgi:hypothetical protein
MKPSWVRYLEKHSRTYFYVLPPAIGSSAVERTLWKHYYEGPSLCWRKTYNKPQCPVCDAADEVEKARGEKAAKKLWAAPKVCVNAIVIGTQALDAQGNDDGNERPTESVGSEIIEITPRMWDQIRARAANPGVGMYFWVPERSVCAVVTRFGPEGAATYTGDLCGTMDQGGIFNPARVNLMDLYPEVTTWLRDLPDLAKAWELDADQATSDYERASRIKSIMLSDDDCPPTTPPSAPPKPSTPPTPTIPPRPSVPPPPWLKPSGQ